MRHLASSRGGRRIGLLAVVLAGVLGSAMVASPAGAASAPQPQSAHPPASFPLHTSGRWVLDANNSRVKLASVNWDGAESPEFVVGGLDQAKLGDIAHWIKANGFNSVRLPWSNEMYEHDPVVKDEYVAANPSLRGKHAMRVFDEVIDALGQQGLMVILDDHVSRADWCCSTKDGNALWYTDQYPESTWLADWKGIASRYRDKPQVVGAELRNEIRQGAGAPKPTWGDGNPKTDWAAAATKGGDEVLAANPNLLVVVGGLGYQTDLTGVANHRITLSRANRLVYAPHAYKWEYDVAHGYDAFKRQVSKQWGYILRQNQSYTAPLWISEFGTCITWNNHCDQKESNFSNAMQRYFKEGDIDWAYWQLGSTQSDSLDHGSGKPRKHGAVDWYGLLNTKWSGPADVRNVDRIKALEKMTQHP